MTSSAQKISFAWSFLLSGIGGINDNADIVVGFDKGVYTSEGEIGYIYA